MKVKDLIERLQEFPQDLDIVMSSDSEGNSFHELTPDMRECFFSESEAEIYDDNDAKEMIKEAEEDNYDLPIFKKVLCFWP